ncbi:hypothetical protein A1E_01210 [Rickettsia canadensis str. McKiel]|uniref:Uncharacterized protein n=1 Tax=Rickettsia canadensis (strain McKiel) TaxID=293613 RepID=A8EXV4_RICCK|nr:hypothetical protein A1E_01210 [Rickettsia canadensis str. McKiel]
MVNISNGFEIDENILFRKDNKLLFITTQNSLITRGDEIKAEIIFYKKAGSFLKL